MQLKPLEQWICDECGEKIETPGDGYVEWLHSGKDDEKHHGFRIIHRGNTSPLGIDRCHKYLKSYGKHDLALTDFLGERGIVILLSLLDPGPRHAPELKKVEVEIREWAELFRRLHVPHYEEARLYWDAADRDGYFDGANEVWLYLPKTLKNLIDEYGEEDDDE